MTNELLLTLTNMEERHANCIRLMKIHQEAGDTHYETAFQYKAEGVRDGIDTILRFHKHILECTRDECSEYILEGVYCSEYCKIHDHPTPEHSDDDCDICFKQIHECSVCSRVLIQVKKR